MRGRHEGQLLAHALGDLLDVARVLLRQDDGLHALAVGGEHLLLEAADRQDVAAQRDLAGHGDVAVDLAPRLGRDHGRGHRDAGGRAVLRHGAFWQVDVDVVLLVEVLRQAEGIGAAADVGERGLRRLLHDVAELARQDELALALKHGDFSRQDRTADFGPGHARRDADLRLLLRLRLQELHAAEEVRQVAARHADRRLFALDDLARGLAADLADEALELAHARLARVVLDDVLQHACAEADVLAGEAVLFTLTADEVALCDLELLVLGVARELDDLHAVA